MSETKHTPGPWAWFGQGNGSIYLATTHSGRRYVMGFERKGMRGAQPVFQPKENRGMVKAEELLQFAVGNPNVVGMKAAKSDSSVYRYDIRGIDCADACLIAAAPELLTALKAALQFMTTEECVEFDLKAAKDAIAKAEGRSP